MRARKKRDPFTLTPELARTHASPVLAIDARAIGRAFALDDDQPLSPLADPATFDGSVALVTIRGPLTQRATMNMCGYSDGYDAIENRVCDALEDERVGAVVLSIDSPGGDAAGLFESIGRMLAVKAKSGKPIYAYADETIASAAYALACMADKIFMPQSAEIGSVGCLAIHCDETAANAADGLKYTIFRSGPRKAEGNPIEPLSDSAAASLQARVNMHAEQFFALVASSRNLNVEAVRALGGAMFFGPAALQTGLVDGFGSLDSVLTAAASARPGAAMTEEESKRMADLEARLAKLEAPPAPPSSDDPDDDPDSDEDEDEDYGAEDEDEDEEEDSAAPPAPPKPKPMPPAPKEKKNMKSKASRLAAENRALKAELAKSKMMALINAAVKEGRLPPGKKDKMIARGEQMIAVNRELGMVALESVLDSLPAHKIKESVTPGAGGTTAVLLTPEDKAVCKQMGISEAEFAKSKAEDQAKKVSA